MATSMAKDTIENNYNTIHQDDGGVGVMASAHGQAADQEALPLLLDDPNTHAANNDGLDGAEECSSFSKHSAATRQRVLFIIPALVLTIELGTNMTQAPINALMEEIICRNYVALAAGSQASLPSPGDPICKSPDVQGRLATMRGWQMGTEVIPSLLSAIPYALLADRIGRKPILIMAFLGIFLELLWQVGVLALSSHAIVPLWTIYLGALWTFIGAFNCVGPSLIYTILGDVVPPAGRASVFFRVSFAFLIGDLVSGPLTGTLMNHGGPWLSIMVAVGIVASTFVVLVMLPETMPPPAASADEPEPEPEPLGALVRASLRDLWAFVVAHTHLAALALPLAFYVLGRAVQDALLQYATKRYQLTWARAAFVLTVRDLANVVLFVAVFPYASHVLTVVRGLSPARKDLLMGRWAGTIGAAGAFLIALSPTPVAMALALVVFAVGTCLSPVLRSLLSGLVDQHHGAKLHNVISFLEMIGVLVAGPGLSKALGVGIALGGPWAGLPFMLAGLSLSLSATMLWMYRLPAGDGRAAQLS